MERRELGDPWRGCHEGLWISGHRETYKNFEMKAKFKGEGTGNSGIFCHSTLKGVDIEGVQVEVDPDPGMHTGRTVRKRWEWLDGQADRGR